MSCRFYIYDLAITSARHTPVAFSIVFKAGLYTYGDAYDETHPEKYTS